MTEYVLILSLIALAATASFSGLSTTIMGALTKISNFLSQ